MGRIKINKNIIGLTGLYCSGKSTAEKYVKDAGYFVIDVDKIGHEVLNEQTDKIIFSFNDKILSRGKIDRKKLGEIVFKDKNKLKLLNSIVHPAMVKKIKNILKNTSEKNICINAALLFEMGLHQLCSKIIIIKAPFFKIIERARSRDKHSFIRILKIIFSQKVLALAKKSSVNADIFYINNNSGRKALKKNISEILYTREIICLMKNQKNIMH